MFIKLEKLINVITDMDDIHAVDSMGYQNELDAFYNYASDIMDTTDDHEIEIELNDDDEIIIEFIQMVHNKITK